MPRPSAPALSGLLAAARDLNPLAHPRLAALAGRLAGDAGGPVLVVSGGAGFLALAFQAAGQRVALAEADPLAAFAAQTLARPLAAPALDATGRAVLADAGRVLAAPPGLFPPPHAPDRLRRALEIRPPGPDRDFLALTLWSVVREALAAPRSPDEPLADVDLREPFEAALSRAMDFLAARNRLPEFAPQPAGARLLVNGRGAPDDFPGFSPALAVLDLSPCQEPDARVRRFLAPLARDAENPARISPAQGMEILAAWRKAAPECRFLAVPGPGGQRRRAEILSLAREAGFHPPDAPGPAGTLVLDSPEPGPRARVGEPEKSPQTRALETLEALLSGEGFRVTQGDAPDLLARKGARSLHFLFPNPGDPARISRAARDVAEKDNHRLDNLALVVAPDRPSADRLKARARVKDFPRALFLSLDEILSGPFSPRKPDAVREFPATVRIIEPAGDRDDLFLLRLDLPDVGDFHPGQFVMAATSPGRGAAKPGTGQAAFLKRPFSVHRVLVPGFGPDFPGGLDLPPALARLARPARPHALDLVVRVLPHGRGTQELRNVRPGARIALLGPLGRPADLAEWSASGIRRLHLVGGGVGIAPLVRFAQEAVFLGLETHAFLGVDRPESLACRLPGCGDAPLPRLYVDELLNLGMPPENLHLACEAGAPAGGPAQGPRGENLCAGLATEPWEAALAREQNPPDLLAVACGPQPMLNAAREIAAPRGVRLHVLLERRMACGLGVCMSCACKTKKDGEPILKRVCADGPLFPAEDLAWD